MVRLFPLLKVYYDEAGTLIFVYPPLWSIGFSMGSDLEALEEAADEAASTPE